MNQEPTPSTSPQDSSRDSAESLGDTLRWAFQLEASPALTGATWLAREIVPDASDAFEAITATTTSLAALRELKSAFKMLRSCGATTAERSLAARLYAATLAAALIRHRELITSQDPANLLRAFTELTDDDTMPDRVRDLAALAIDFVRNK